MEHFTYFSMLGDWRVRISRSKLFCFFSICILRTRSASESLREIAISGAFPLTADCGLGGRFKVNDSSTCGESRSTVCRRRGIGIFTSISPLLGAITSSSSKSGVDVHDCGRLVRGAKRKAE